MQGHAAIQNFIFKCLLEKIFHSFTFENEERNFISPINHVIKLMFFLLHNHQMKYQIISESLWYIFFLVAKGMTYHVTIAKVIFLCVKITSYFHVQESWPGIFSYGCIIKLIIIFILSWLLPWVFKISTGSFTSLYGEENKLVIYVKICGVLKRFW